MCAKIIAIDFEAMHDDERPQLLIVTNPHQYSENCLILAKGQTNSYIGTYSVWSDPTHGGNAAEPVDQDVELTDGWADVNDEIIFMHAVHSQDCLVEEALYISDICLVTADKVLLETSWHEGKLIETYGQLLINYLGLSDGDWSATIGTFLEYNKDGEIGDLDLPLEVFEQRIPAT
jgi:hypothetical protein